MTEGTATAAYVRSWRLASWRRHGGTAPASGREVRFRSVGRAFRPPTGYVLRTPLAALPQNWGQIAAREGAEDD